MARLAKDLPHHHRDGRSDSAGAHGTAREMAPAVTGETTARSRERIAMRLRPIGLVLAIAITVATFVFRDEVRHLAAYGYPGIFLLSLIGNASIALPLPAFLTAFIGGGVLNPLAVGLVAASGAALGELTGYLAGVSGQATIEHRAGYDRIRAWMRRRGLATLFVLAAIPNPLFDLAGIAAGALRIPVPTFLLATWAGKLVKFAALAFLGAGAIRLLG